MQFVLMKRKLGIPAKFHFSLLSVSASRRYLDFFSLDLSSGRVIKRKGDDNKPLVPPKLERPPRVSLNPLSYLESEDKLLVDFNALLRQLQGKQNTGGGTGTAGEA